MLQPQVTFYMVRLKGQDPWLSLQHAPAAPQFPIACEELVWGISPWGWGTVDIYGGHWGAAAGQWVVGLGWGKQEVRAQWGWSVYPWVGRAGLDGSW